MDAALSMNKVDSLIFSSSPLIHKSVVVKAPSCKYVASCLTVNFIVFGTLHCFWDSGYLCHFSTEIAEIWSPGTFFKDVWAYKISAQNLLYFRSYKIFSGGKSEGKIGLELRELKFITKY